MSQWGPVFYEKGMGITPLVQTEMFEEIKPDSLIEDLVLLTGAGDMESLCTKYIGMAFDEFERTANISNEVSG